jgi:hypothetical protein
MAIKANLNAMRQERRPLATPTLQLNRPCHTESQQIAL